MTDGQGGTAVNATWASIDNIFNVLKTTDDMVFLDLGSGTGRWLCQALAQFNATAVYGIELIQSCVDIAKKHLQDDRAHVIRINMHQVTDLSSIIADGIAYSVKPTHVTISSPGMGNELLLKILKLLHGAKRYDSPSGVRVPQKPKDDFNAFQYFLEIFKVNDSSNVVMTSAEYGSESKTTFKAQFARATNRFGNYVKRF